jgi:hypothetical protein
MKALGRQRGGNPAADESSCAEQQHGADAGTILRRAIVSGTCASVVSSAGLLWAGGVDCGSVFAPVNAVSHWIWGERALHAQLLSVRHTVFGYVIHHAMSVFWACLYEAGTEAAIASGHASPGPLALLSSGVAVAALACFVDLVCTPRRLTPGFERKLSAPTLSVVYLLFGLALPIGAMLRARARRGP